MADCIRRFLTRLSGGFDPERFWRDRDKSRSPSPLGLFYRFRYLRAQNKFCAAIPLSAQIDGRLLLPHGPSGVMISSGAVIGKNCTVFQQVTIGSVGLNGAKNYGAPVIGDNVYLGAGAKIIGAVRVGNNVRVGAGAVVFRDVPDNATVVCQPPRVLLRDAPRDNSFLAFDPGRETSNAGM